MSTRISQETKRSLTGKATTRWLVAGMLALAVLVLTAFLLEIVWHIRYDRLQPQREAADAAASGMASAYRQAGCLYTDAEEFRRTAFWPAELVVAPPAAVRSHHAFLGDLVDWDVTLDSGNGRQVHGSGLVRRFRSPAEQTRATLSLAAAGPAEVLAVTNSSSRRIATALRRARLGSPAEAMRDAAPPNWQPRNAWELHEYQAWLRRELGGRGVRDAWGRPIRLALVNGRLVCSSAGPNGRWGDADDLREASPKGPAHRSVSRPSRTAQSPVRY